MKRTLALGAAACAVLLLGGCAASGQTDTGSAMSTGMEAVAPGAMPADMAAPEGAIVDKALAPAQQVITTAWMTVRVESVATASTEVSGLISQSDGSIQQQDVSNAQGSASATIIARIPAASLERFIAQVSTIGTVESVSRQASDVTQQTIDLDARVDALTASITRLKELLAQTTNVADLVAVETELANRQAELDSLTSQRAYLADQVAMSTVTISLLPQVTVGAWQAPGFVAGLQNGLNALLSLIVAAITAAGFLLPFIVIPAIVVVPITWLLVRRARRPRE